MNFASRESAERRMHIHTLTSCETPTIYRVAMQSGYSLLAFFIEISMKLLCDPRPRVPIIFERISGNREKSLAVNLITATLNPHLKYRGSKM